MLSPSQKHCGLHAEQKRHALLGYEREGRACTGVTNSLELNPGGELYCTWEESSLCFAEIGVGGRSDRIQRQV